MQNFTTTRLIVRGASQKKNPQGVASTPPPARARVNGRISDFDGAGSFALAQLVQRLLAKKNSLVLKCRHFEFVDPCDVIFT